MTEKPETNSDTKTEKVTVTETVTKTEGAAGMQDGKKPGPKASPVQVRDAGEDAQSEVPEKWDDQDEAVDESFPASDSSAKY